MATQHHQTSQEAGAELSLDTAALLAQEEHGVSIAGRSPWYLAWRRLSRNYVALASLFLFVLILLSCGLAPVYADHVAHTDSATNHISDRVKVGDKVVTVISAGGTYTDPK